MLVVVDALYVRQRMKALVHSSIASVVIAGIHAGLLWAILILGFVGSFGAPQGGDAGYVYRTTGPAAVFTRVLEVSASILLFPASLLSHLTIPPALLWAGNSLLWGCVITAIGVQIIKQSKKPNKARLGNPH
jgi:hypothetical protein